VCRTHGGDNACWDHSTRDEGCRGRGTAEVEGECVSHDIPVILLEIFTELSECSAYKSWHLILAIRYYLDGLVALWPWTAGVGMSRDLASFSGIIAVSASSHLSRKILLTNSAGIANKPSS